MGFFQNDFICSIFENNFRSNSVIKPYSFISKKNLAVIQISLFIVGLIGLWLGTKWVVKSALDIAQRFNLSHAFVGLAILAVGTDLPEVFITFKASFLQLKGIESSGIITGNAIGSSISQISIILGIAGLFMNFAIEKKELFRDGIALLGSIILLFIVGYDGEVTRVEGLILLLAYVIYYIVLLKSNSNAPSNNEEQEQLSIIKLATYLVIGFVVLIFSSHLVVENALFFAKKWGLEQSFVGIVLIGLGTSLPELAVSIGAAIKKSAGISVGNVIGSNIFDTIIPVGIGGTISEISMESGLLKFDLPVLFVITSLVVVFLATKKGISKREAIILIALYLLYVLAKIFIF
jgi:cation:H+ antiporter